MRFWQFQSNLFNSLKKALFSLFVVATIVIIAGQNLPVSANSQGTTIIELVISPQNVSSVTFTVNPGNIFLGELLTFTLGPALTSTNTVLSNVPCEIWIQPPNASIFVVFAGITNNQGICTYRTNQTPTQQNLVLLTQPLTPDFPRPSGTQNVANQSSSIPGSPLITQSTGGNVNVSSINGIVGGGNAFGLVTYQGNNVLSNTVTYAVSGGITGIDADYPTDTGTGSGIGSGNNTGNNSGIGGNNNNSGNNNNIPGSNLFDFLPRTGGFVASIGGLIGLIILIIFVISRRRTIEEKYNQLKSKK